MRGGEVTMDQGELLFLTLSGCSQNSRGCETTVIIMNIALATEQLFGRLLDGK